MKILVTGAAGSIGAHCVLRLLSDGRQVCGLDNFNDYYDPQLFNYGRRPPVSNHGSSWMKDSDDSSPGSVTTTHCATPIRHSWPGFSGGLYDWT